MYKLINIEKKCQYELLIDDILFSNCEQITY